MTQDYPNKLRMPGYSLWGIVVMIESIPEVPPILILTHSQEMYKLGRE
jgi:hypothetical protein